MHPQIADAFARLPDYLGGHVAVSLTALALGLAVSLPLALALGAPAGTARQLLLAVASVVQTIPGPCAARAVLPAAARHRGADRAGVRRRLLGARLSAVGAGARALLHAAGAAEHHHRARRRRSRRQAGRARRRHDAAAVAVHGRAAARAAGHHGRHPHRRGLGDRHRDAVDADRADQPRQLHLHRPADAELGVRAVRLRRRGGAGARGRSIAGADGKRTWRARKRRRVAAGALGTACCIAVAALAPGLVAARARPT